MLHYNFPPYSVGEVGRIGATGRREIGHGKLAWRALKAVLPSKEDFDYTIRLVSDITESNGSSSMATVCGSSLALMDAGVPIKNSVSGIAMGLIKEGDSFAVLSDILGDEDHLGDMDFKVAGTKDGITSLQMDIKITGITTEIMDQALSQAKGGRLHILDEMNKAIDSPRTELGPYTPRIEMIKVKRDNIGEIIGKGGATIKDIIEQSGASVDISDNGTVKIAGTSKDSIQKAFCIESLLVPAIFTVPLSLISTLAPDCSIMSLIVAPPFPIISPILSLFTLIISILGVYGPNSVLGESIALFISSKI